jgi:molecular chaperone DnaK (HSP70)
MPICYGINLDAGQWGVSKQVDTTDATLLGQQVTVAAWSDQMVEIGDAANIVLGHDAHTSCVQGINFFEGLSHDKTYSLGPHTVNAQDLVALTMGKMTRIYPQLEGESTNVLAVSAGMHAEARLRIRQAARQANLRIDHVVNTSTAVAAHYIGHVKRSSGHIFAVIYVGESHTEYAVFQPTTTGLDVLAVQSEPVGEYHLRQIFLRMVEKKYRLKTGRDLRADQYSVVQLSRDFEHLCKYTPISIELVGTHLDISRADVIERSTDVLDKLLNPIARLLSRVGLSDRGDLELFLAGSLLQYAWVKKRLESTVRLTIVPDDSGAAATLGAAWCAAMLVTHGASAITGEPIPDLKPSAVPVAHQSYGLLSVIYDVGARSDQDQNSILIKKGSSLPARGSYHFTTHHEGQLSMRCTVTATDRVDAQMVQISLLQDEDCLFGSAGTAQDPDSVMVEFSLGMDYELTCVFKNMRTRQTHEFKHQVGQVSCSVFERLPLRA